MGKIIASINITPDGFCRHDVVIADNEHHQFAISLLSQSGLVLFGRNTFQLFESYWPLVTGNPGMPEYAVEFARLINEKQKLVFSKTMSHSKWQPTRFLSEINNDEIYNLKQSGNILIFGSPTIISELAARKLIDDYYFTVEPFIVGSGKRLFENGHERSFQRLQLVETLPFASGVTTFHYSR